MRNAAKTIETLIDNIADCALASRRVAIICHINPDGDTIGSGLALCRVLRSASITADVYCNDKIYGKLNYLDGACEIINTISDVRYDLAIAVDCHDETRMGVMSSIYSRAAKRLIIDHHPFSGNISDLHLIATEAAATAQIMYKVIKVICSKSNARVDDITAKLLYSALVTDSGAFSFSSVTEDTMLTAAELLRYDIQADKIVEHFIKTVSPRVFALRCKVLSAAKFFEDGKIALIKIGAEDFESTGTSLSNTEGIINYILDIEGVAIAISIVEIGDMSYKISLRTDGSANAGVIASTFGGGGHARAAGCRISGYYEDVKDKVLKACRDSL
ncbi:MAG: DHH family phosphoesterase [Clostridia bacterium]|nr:DHH family phosphoesterase [Clostridia bacterium]